MSTMQTAARADILPALSEVFRSHGFEGASIGRIVAATGLGRSSLYHLFPGGKEEMAREVLTHVDAWFARNIFEPLEQDAPALALVQMFDAVTEYFREGGRICLVGAFALDGTRDRFAAEVRAYFSRWVQSLASCLTRGGMAAADASAAAAQVVALIQGAIVLARATGSPEDFQLALLAARGLCRL
ncbi:TetR/AcrR family transcriptional regulator [Cribrihabitans neustonicus]|uniref:TetR/AcrR family transcriptional regulator n=1 Tax=Cribrihabitans neustonicus TaxID=1429085 RepID=UPI003B593C1F